MSSEWTFNDIGSQSGVTTLITGASDGIGVHYARHIAKRGALVIGACRNLKKAQSVADKVNEEVGKQADDEKNQGAGSSGRMEIVELDLSSFRSVRECAKQVRERCQRIDVLCLNAGVMALPERLLTEDGNEMQFQTNHLGHFLLTQLLIDLVPDNGRIVILSSGAHSNCKEIPLNDVNFSERAYGAWAAYSQSKLANLLFQIELKRRLEKSGKEGIRVVAAHPGWSNTNLQTYAKENMLVRGLMFVGEKLLAQDAEAGSMAMLRAATDPTVKSGEYYGPSKYQAYGPPNNAAYRTAPAQDDKMALGLWTASEKICDITFLNE